MIYFKKFKIYLDLFGIILTPIMGIICSKHGKKGLMILISMIAFILACLIMLILPKYQFTDLIDFDYKFHPIIIIPLIFIAIFYSTYSAAY